MIDLATVFFGILFLKSIAASYCQVDDTEYIAKCCAGGDDSSYIPVEVCVSLECNDIDKFMPNQENVPRKFDLYVNHSVFIGFNANVAGFPLKNGENFSLPVRKFELCFYFVFLK